MSREDPSYRQASKMQNVLGDAKRSGLADPQHDFSKHVPFRQALVGLVGLDQRKSFRDRNFELRGLDGDIESPKFVDAGNAVIRDEFHAPSFLRLGLDAVRIGKSASRSQYFDGVFQLVTARQCKNCIGTFRREAARHFHNILMTRVDRRIGAHVAHELQAIETGRGREYAGAPKLGELDGERSDPTRGAVNDDGLTTLDRERVVDALKRGQPGSGDGASVFQIEVCGNMGNLVRGDGDIFGVEATLRIGPAVGIDFISDLETADPRTDFRNHTRTIGAEDERKTRLPSRKPTGPNIGVPRANASRVQRDQHLGGLDLRYWHNMLGEHFGAAEMVDRRRRHYLRDARRAPSFVLRVRSRLEHALSPPSYAPRATADPRARCRAKDRAEASSTG